MLCQHISMWKWLLAIVVAMVFIPVIKIFNTDIPNDDPSVLKTYIIHVQPPQTNPKLLSTSSRLNLYKSFLPAKLLKSSNAGNPSRLVSSYFNIFTGFAARLTEEELLEVKSKPGFLHAYPDRLLPLQTTYSPIFLGLRRNANGLWNDSSYGKGVIIGVLDTGIMPDHPSFNDKGVPPPPSKWKGVCNFKKANCNNKIIGAVDFTREATIEPHDYNGHGTHTASTAAGNFVENAKAHGVNYGTAAGMAPHAHLAIYKVCTSRGFCSTAKILEGMDAAILDGVDVMSLSIGKDPLPFYMDDIAIAAIRAIENGILVSFAAGNAGPGYKTLSNEAPWILTVGASTMDRLTRTTSALGDPYTAFCTEDHYDGEANCEVVKIKEKQATTTEIIPAASNVEYSDACSSMIVSYPTTSSLKPSAPALADFSSRGPSKIDPNILKPDIIGPGVDILAAWPFETKFKMDSGTSMATPHLSGIMALLKSVHPNWSPAAIKSAIMTTASSIAKDGNSIIDLRTNAPADLFGIGAGHVSPSKAKNPGLIYDIKPNDYLMYLCGLGYTDDQVGHIAARPKKCSHIGRILPKDLNYPSFMVFLGPLTNYRVQVTRTVTNVGSATSSYTVQVTAPDVLSVDVVPEKISFTSVYEEIRYTIMFGIERKISTKHLEGHLIWVSDDDPNITVRSPIMVEVK